MDESTYTRQMDEQINIAINGSILDLFFTQLTCFKILEKLLEGFFSFFMKGQVSALRVVIVPHCSNMRKLHVLCEWSRELQQEYFHLLMRTEGVDLIFVCLVFIIWVLFCSRVVCRGLSSIVT